MIDGRFLEPVLFRPLEFLQQALTDRFGVRIMDPYTVLDLQLLIEIVACPVDIVPVAVRQVVADATLIVVKVVPYHVLDSSLKSPLRKETAAAKEVDSGHPIQIIHQTVEGLCHDTAYQDLPAHEWNMDPVCSKVN